MLSLLNGEKYDCKLFSLDELEAWGFWGFWGANERIDRQLLMAERKR